MKKFENNEDPMKAFIAKASKTYSEIYANSYEIKAKGLKKGFKKDITIEDFNNTSINEKTQQMK